MIPQMILSNGWQGGSDRKLLVIEQCSLDGKATRRRKLLHFRSGSTSNCIAASFAALGIQINAIHQYMHSHSASSWSYAAERSILTPNDALNGIANGIALAHRLFMEKHNTLAVTLMVVNPGERNVYDQYGLQQALWENHEVEMCSQSLADIHTNGSIIEKGLLTLRLNHSHPVVVSVVFFRAGYTPDDYHGENTVGLENIKPM